ncbi:hypothetical protein K469DRAFT_476212, partial [Zopfia rhizophila CBS 207.26]
KCVFHRKEVKFLEYIISRNRILTLINTKEVYSFLRFTGFCRQFIKGYLRITIPLTELLKKD